MRVKILSILFTISLFTQAAVTFKVDSTTYLIGEQAIFTLEYQGDGEVIWPKFNDTLTKDLEIVEQSKIDTLSPGNYQQKIYVTAWDSGYYLVPPIQINNESSAPSLLRFNTVAINSNEDIKPIKEQMDTPFIFDEIKELVLWTLLILLIIAGLVFVGFFIYRKYFNKPEEEPVIPTRPVMEVLWERFNHLAESKVWEKNQEKEFQSELSLILRKFLEFKFRIKALEETTGNIIHQLNSIEIDKVNRDNISHILNFSDMVKFAKQKGAFTQHENALNVLRELLESHTEREETASE